MSWLRFFHRRRRDRDLAREIAAHIHEERAENIARGLTPEEADRRARIKFGSARRVHEDLWYQNSFAFLEGILRDLKYAVRSLAHAPGFALTVILIMALGIGANTAVFSVMNAVLLKSLPVADPQRVFYLRHRRPARRRHQYRKLGFFLLLARLRRPPPSGSRLLRCHGLRPPQSMARPPCASAPVPKSAEGDMVSGNFFSGLGVRIARGRGFTEDDETHHSPIVVLSYNYWTRRFSRAPGVLGQDALRQRCATHRRGYHCRRASKALSPATPSTSGSRSSLAPS